MDGLFVFFVLFIYLCYLFCWHGRMDHASVSAKTYVFISNIALLWTPIFDGAPRTHTKTTRA